MKILKFGGKSLAGEKGIRQVISIIKDKVDQGESLAVVISARGKATDQLENILTKAVNHDDYQEAFEVFKTSQVSDSNREYVEKEFTILNKLYEGVFLLGNYSKKIKDQILSQGEVISGKILVEKLKEIGVNAHFTDSRELIITDDQFGEAQPIDNISKENVRRHFEKYNGTTVNVVTGFIASNQLSETTTLGRNGSNYTAALLANYLDAEELQNYTHVDGIYTADPDLIADAKKIDRLSFNEANELAYFGATILHAKTIIPLIEKEIPLRILNTFNREGKGTLITSTSDNKGIKSLSVLKDVSLLNLEGRGLLGKAGIDARIFKALAYKNVSVSIISQGSSERGIGLVVSASQARDAKQALEEEFEADFYNKDVSTITIERNVSVISIIGQDLSTFHKPYNALIKNQIVPILFNNTVTGKNISLVVKKEQLNKALHVIHGEIFGIDKKINIAIFGHGLVGGTLIKQILKSKEDIRKRKKIDLTVFAVANSRKVITNAKGLETNWKNEMEDSGKAYTVEDIIKFAEEHHLENLIAIDNTASTDFTDNYVKLVEKGFDLVSSNKIANTLSFDFYKELRQVLSNNQKQYLYETNVGAGLPLIDTIKLLHLSGENITRIKGVFSGSLSYLFNTFSTEDRPFSEVLQEAIDQGFTEPDPREDLCGNDVGRKLLILARELDLANEFEDVNIHNLIPENLREGDRQQFLGKLKELDKTYQKLKAAQEPDHVLRYIGDLHGDLSQEKGILDVKLVSVPSTGSLGQVKGSDSIFEIYTESYGDQPVIIQGAGAGAAVTARGVFGDILRIAAP
ncbi:bifunctional aspartate kinase/homoserine dehydrogenase I [Aquimarina sp. ERC-38]|uniref:bifunctional aspartate kinase/homoserine dehydrogenase I n=1 Tax=Aquimarina sp. ERC-38 TaxID=2949996 RepID=UPI002245AAFE|nr:bifunctional aspartate kinase/homoserine dehydrogenase I [Aquimarina sp. ERC-38]UZO81011.1 bifunctional aspartate kinase/homoserine dehydrogenase I [Aquimarina sp. ERC-38]